VGPFKNWIKPLSKFPEPSGTEVAFWVVKSYSRIVDSLPPYLKCRDLEDQRTRISLSLTEEKQLLKRINTAEKERRLLQEYLDHDKRIQTKKVRLLN